MCRSFLFPLCFVLGLVINSLADSDCEQQKCKQVTKVADDQKYVHFDYFNDFENGMLYPWIEMSRTGSVKWKIENNLSPWEPENKAPIPANGTNYLRVDRGKSLSFGVAVLRSQEFTLSPVETAFFSFDFWIRSKWPQFTNLELYFARNGKESLLFSLSNYSSIDSKEWQYEEIILSDTSYSSLTLVFYAYCGADIEDAVAIDNLMFKSQLPSTVFTEPATTEPTTTTTAEPPATTDPSPPTTTTTEPPATTDPSPPTTTTTQPPATTDPSPPTTTTTEPPATADPQTTTTTTTEPPATTDPQTTTTEPPATTAIRVNH